MNIQFKEAAKEYVDKALERQGVTSTHFIVTRENLELAFQHGALWAADTLALKTAHEFQGNAYEKEFQEMFGEIVRKSDEKE